jgi:hypothetical protein
MIFSLPRVPLCFEIPDAWISESGIHDFVPNTWTYCAAEAPMERQSLVVPIADVQLPVRCPGVTLDTNGFSRDRFLTAARAIVSGRPWPPIPICSFEERTVEGYRYCVVDGYHRFYASIAAGYSHIPAADFGSFAAYEEGLLRELGLKIRCD